MITGIVAGLIVPLVVMLFFYLWKSGGMSPASFVNRLVSSGTLTNAISFSVFANLFIFLLFNRFDMLKASKGILGITIVWAVLVFILKFS
jgi:hypothetical protein